MSWNCPWWIHQTTWTNACWPSSHYFSRKRGLWLLNTIFFEKIPYLDIDRLNQCLARSICTGNVSKATCSLQATLAHLTSLCKHSDSWRAISLASKTTLQPRIIFLHCNRHDFMRSKASVSWQCSSEIWLLQRQADCSLISLQSWQIWCRDEHLYHRCSPNKGALWQL